MPAKVIAPGKWAGERAEEAIEHSTMSNNVKYRRSPHLLSYWDDGELVFYNYATGVSVTASPLATDVLNLFTDWLSADSLFSHMPGFSRSSLRRVVSLLVKFTLLERSDRKKHPAEIAMERWRYWNPAAGFFHFSTKDVPYEPDDEKIDEFLRWRLKTTPIPPSVKRYETKASVPLPTAKKEGEFPEVLLARRTWRKFSKRPLELDALATLLDLTFGVQGWMDSGALGLGALKTSPSPGASHSIEPYVLVREVKGLARGLYHYHAERHALTRLKPGASAKKVSRYIPTQPYFGRASALVLMSAVFARNEWQYPYARSYRSLLLEAGHFCQTFCLVATWLGLAPFCTAALADSRIEEDLEIDGITESILYAAGVGTRPPNVDWAPEPEGEEQPKRLPPRRWTERREDESR